MHALLIRKMAGLDYKGHATKPHKTIMWTTVIAMLVTCFVPDTLMSFGHSWWSNRRGITLNYKHLTNYYAFADFLFITLLVITIVSIVVVIVAIGFAIKDLVVEVKIVRHKEKRGGGPSFWVRLIQKLLLYIGLMIMLLFLTVAGLINITCADNTDIAEGTITLKVYSTTSDAKTNLRLAAANIMAPPNDHSINGMFMSDGLVTYMPGSDSWGVMTQADLYGHSLRHANGTTLSKDMISQYCESGMIAAVVTADSGHITVTAVTLASETPAGIAALIKLPQDLGQHIQDVHDTNFMSRLGTADNPLVYMSRWQSFHSNAVEAGASWVLLQTAMASVGRGAMMGLVGGFHNSLHQSLRGVAWCEVGLSYANVIMSFFILSIVLAIIVKSIMSTIPPPPHNPAVPASDFSYQPMDQGNMWRSVQSMGNQDF